MKQLITLLMIVPIYAFGQMDEDDSISRLNVIKGKINVNEGTMILEFISPIGPVDTLAIADIQVDSSFTFTMIPSGNYYLSVWPDEEDRDETANLENRLLPKSYYQNAYSTDSATIIRLGQKDTLEIEMSIGYVKDDIDDFKEENSVFLLQIGDRGGLSFPSIVPCAFYLARNRFSESQEETFTYELFSYSYLTKSGEYGLFKNDLDAGLYRLRIDPSISGLPMLPESQTFIEFEVTDDAEQDDYDLTITLFPDGFRVDVVQVLSLQEEQSLLYPCPANNYLIIDGISVQKVSDLSGRDHNIRYLEPDKLDISHLPSGVYLLQQKGSNLPLKFIKQ